MGLLARQRFKESTTSAKRREQKTNQGDDLEISQSLNKRTFCKGSYGTTRFKRHDARNAYLLEA